MTRLIITWFLAASLGFGLGCAKQAERPQEILARIHFRGFEQLESATNGTTLQDIWRLPETAALRGVALDKLAAAWSASLLPARDGAETNRAAWMRPLLDDVLRTESFLEIVARTNAPSAWTLALRLKDDRAQLWQEHSTKLVETARTNRQYGFARRTNSWLLVASDSGSAIRAPLWIEFTGEFPVNGFWPALSTNAAWLEADLNGPELSRLFPVFANFNPPKTRLTVHPTGKNLRTEAQLRFERPPNWMLEPWRFPTNTIRDPLISFSAVRGIGPWLTRQAWFQKLGLASTPNQAVAWGQEDIPLQVQFAAPVENATNEIRRLVANWIPQVDSNVAHLPWMDSVFVDPNFTLVSRRSLGIVPFIRRAPEPVGEFLNGGFFPIQISPNDVNTNPAPPELLAQVQRTNLVYYNWEITQKRLAQCIFILARANILLTLPRMETNSLSYHWLDAAQSSLGNTITELTMTSPAEASLVRRSHSGFSAVELLALANWIEGTNFPRMNLEIGFQPPMVLPKVPPARPATPAR